VASTHEAPVDSRVQRSKDAVLAATYALLSERGVGGVSVDEVSRRCGVAKTTIYRHWPSRAALLLDACSTLNHPAPTPDSGSLRGDLRLLADQLAGDLGSARWAAVLPSILDAAERDPDLARLHHQLHVGLAQPFTEVVQRAQARGELRPGADTTAHLLAGILGPLFYRRWFSREPIDSAFLDTVLDQAVPPTPRATGDTGLTRTATDRPARHQHRGAGSSVG